MNSYELKRFLLSIAYPNRCAFCMVVIAYNAYYCADCEAKIPYYNERFSVDNIDEAIAICKYDEMTKRAIFQLKENNNICATQTAAHMMAEQIADMSGFCSADFLLPVPITKEAMKARGYHQTLLLAKELSHMINVPINKKIIFSTNKALPQKQLNQAERYNNMKNAFCIKNTVDIRGKSVVVVDDVSTTGATLSAIGKLLKLGGAERVYAVVFAKPCLK